MFVMRSLTKICDEQQVCADHCRISYFSQKKIHIHFPYSMLCSKPKKKYSLYTYIVHDWALVILKVGEEGGKKFFLGKGI